MSNDNTTCTVRDAKVNYVNPGYDAALRPWLPLVHRLQGVGKSRGLSVMTVYLIVDEHGHPVRWLEPCTLHIEPKTEAEALAVLLLAVQNRTEEGNK